MNEKDRILQEIGVFQGYQWKAEIDEIVWMLIKESQKVLFEKEDMSYLYQSERIIRYRFYSYPKEGETRVESIIHELIESNISDYTYTHIAMLIQTSKKYPLMMYEFNKLAEIPSMINPNAPLLLGMGETQGLGDKMFVMLVLSK